MPRVGKGMESLRESFAYCLAFVALPLVTAGFLYAGSQAPLGATDPESVSATAARTELRIERDLPVAPRSSPLSHVILKSDDPETAIPPYLLEELEHLDGLEPIAPVTPPLPGEAQSAALDTEGTRKL